MTTTRFEHAHKFDADGEVPDFWMLVDGDTITATGTGVGPEADAVFDFAGAALSPGFVDIHCHGGGGFGFDEGANSIANALEIHRAHGTTRSVISLVSNPVEVLQRSLAGVAELAAGDPLILGSHLEGPFLDPGHRGAHNPNHLITADVTTVEALIETAAGTLRQITIAPELDGALEAIDLFVRAGVTVAIGHTNATFEQACDAFDHGARVITHAFNAMPGIHHRAPGPIIAAFEDDPVIIEMILDGIHVHPDVARLAFASAAGRIALITDAMAAAGSTDGDYQLGSLAVTVADGKAVLRGTSTIAGSTLTMDDAVRRAILEVRVAPCDAIAAATIVPARAIGMADRHGLLAVGYAADAVRFDDDWQVTGVWAAGSALRVD